jgi:hypothetical protein
MCETCNAPILEFNAVFYCSYLLKVGPLEAGSVKSKRIKKFRKLDSVHIFSASLPCIQTPKFGHYMPQTSLSLSISWATTRFQKSGLNDTQIETNLSIFWRGFASALRVSTLPFHSLKVGWVPTCTPKPFYKIDKLVSIWGPFSPNVLPMESCSVTLWKRARMFEACSDQILEFRRQGGQKHTNKAQFLKLSDFIETMGPYWSRVHACRYPVISIPLSSCGCATSTLAVLKQNLSIKSTN